MSQLIPVPSTEKVFIKGTPRALEGPVLLFEGDVAHLSICYQTDRAYLYGSLSFRGGAVARAIKVHRVGHVPAIYDVTPWADDFYLKREDHLYPDVLEDVDVRRIQSQAGFNQVFHLTICDSDKIPVGDHKVRVTAKIQDEVVAKCEFVIRKLPYRLPEQRCISTCWMHCDSFITQHGVKLFTKDFYKVFASYLDAAVYSGQNMLLIPIFTPAFDTERGHERLTAQLLDIREDEAGNFTFDLTKLEEFLAFVRARGIKYFEMPPFFTQWGAEHAPKILVRGKNGRLRRRFGWDTDSLSDDYRRFVTSLIPVLVAKFRELGIEENVFFHVSDEPKVEQLERWTACKEMILPHLGRCNTLDACDSLEFVGKSEREYSVCIEGNVQKFIEAGVRPLCTYFCCSPAGNYMPNRFLAMPLSRLVVLGALLYRFRISLFLQWGFNFYNSFLSRTVINPYGNTDCNLEYPAGDAFIVYPNYAKRSACKSLRLVATREMFRLSRILYLIEEKHGREAAIALLDEFGIMDFSNYPHTVDFIEPLLMRAVEVLEG